MITVVFMGLLALVVLGGIGYAVFASERKWAGALTAICAAVLGLFVWLVSSYTSVGPSDVGIVTAFGKTEGDIGPGIHWLYPWQSTNTWDGSVQTIQYGRDINQNKPDHCLLVRIGGQQSACITLTFTYKLRDGAADELFRAYRNQPRMNDVLVTRTLDQDMNLVLENYSPIEATALAIAHGGSGSNAAALSPYANQVEALMQKQIGRDILVGPACRPVSCSLNLPYAAYDPSTQSRLNSLQQQRADTLIAQQLEQTNLALARANHDLAANSTLSPGVLVQNCLSIVNQAMKSNYHLPPTFSCLGGSSGVIVSAGK